MRNYTSRMELHCPNCKQIDKVEKVSALIGRSSGTSSYGSAQASIASKLRRPNRPDSGAPLLYFFAVALLFYALIAGWRALSVSTGDLLGPSASLLLSIVLAYLGFRAHVTWQTEEMPRWQRAEHWWQRIHYCGRCDGVYVPGDASITPTEEARKKLRA